MDYKLDLLGNPIYKGDVLAIPVKKGSRSPHIELRLVDHYNDHGVLFTKARPYDGLLNDRAYPLRFPERCVVLTSLYCNEEAENWKYGI